METTSEERADILRRRAGAPNDTTAMYVSLGQVRALCRDVNTVREALEGYHAALAGRAISIPELREAQANARAVLEG